MPYTVDGIDEENDIGFHFNTMEEAFAKAVEMRNRGLKNVTIKDPQGNEVTDGDEERDFNEKQ